MAAGQRRLTVVNVTNGADVDVRLSPLELRLRHWLSSCGLLVRRAPDAQTDWFSLLGRRLARWRSLAPALRGSI